MLRPRVKSVHAPFTLSNQRIIIGLMHYGVAAEIEDDERGSIAHLLTLLDGTRTMDDICADFAVTHPEVGSDSVRDVIQDLVDQGFIEDAAAPIPDDLTEARAARYESVRHFFDWIDITPRSSPYEAQQRLSRSRVVLLGLGGTGTAVAAGLVASGIGSLHCVDFDAVSEANLTRQLLYTEADVGRPKVKVAVERLRAMNSGAAVTGEECQVGSADDVERLMAGCNAFVLCADEPEHSIQEWTNEAALRTGTAWFMSFYTGPMTVVGSFLPQQTGCYTCMWRRESAREVYADATPLIGPRPNAVIAASANVSGHLCSLEVLYFLAGLPQQVPGRIFHHNFANWDHHYFVEVSRDPECPACGTRSGERTGG
jgi:bacteriocin biosynthesis cyclodehydratase domain-containing protein